MAGFGGAKLKSRGRAGGETRGLQKAGSRGGERDAGRHARAAEAAGRTMRGLRMLSELANVRRLQPWAWPATLQLTTRIILLLAGLISGLSCNTGRGAW